MRRLTFVATLTIWLLLASCISADGESALLQKSATAMASQSFSYTVTDCPLCPPPVITEYAPPDRIKLSNSKGHDDWPYYLIVGDRWLFSAGGKRWLEGQDYKFPFMLLSDPRVLLRTADGPRTDGTEDVSGVLHHVVRADLDAERFTSEELPPQALPDTPEGDQARAFYKDFVAGSEVRFWINAESYTVTKMEIDYPPLPEDEDGDDPQPAAITFDYETAMGVPEDPESMPYDEAEEVGRVAASRTAPLQRAIADYKTLHGTYPPSLDPETLSDVLPPSRWPVNPFSGKPVEESADSPGDFHYVSKNEGQDYELSLFDWDSTYSYIDTVRFGHPEDQAY